MQFTTVNTLCEYLVDFSPTTTIWFSSHLFFDLWFKSNENMNSLDLKRKELFYFITRNKFKHMIHSLAIQMYWSIYWPSKDFHPHLLIITIHISPFLKDTDFNTQYNDSNSRQSQHKQKNPAHSRQPHGLGGICTRWCTWCGRSPPYCPPSVD